MGSKFFFYPRLLLISYTACGLGPRDLKLLCSGRQYLIVRNWKPRIAKYEVQWRIDVEIFIIFYTCMCRLFIVKISHLRSCVHFDTKTNLWRIFRLKSLFILRIIWNINLTQHFGKMQCFVNLEQVVLEVTTVLQTAESNTWPICGIESAQTQNLFTESLL
jgi:hypothetical protein